MAPHVHVGLHDQIPVNLNITKHIMKERAVLNGHLWAKNRQKYNYAIRKDKMLAGLGR